MPNVNIRFSEEEYKQLRAVSEEKHLPISSLARSLILQSLTVGPGQVQVLLDVLARNAKLRLHLRRLILFDGDQQESTPSVSPLSTKGVG